jgi:glutathione S-transferase
LRDKERKYGKSCIQQWQLEQKALLLELEKRLWYYEQMLSERDYLLDIKPVFIDFDLFGILGVLLYTGHYKLPQCHTRLAQWYERMKQISFKTVK